MNKRIPPEDYRLLERQYRSKEELRTMLVESLIKREKEAEAKAKAEGKAEGKEEGKAERDRQIARAMAAEGYAHSEIMRLLALNEEELLHLLAVPDSPQ